jgi:predicted MFS family arabinose efflux permease
VVTGFLTTNFIVAYSAIVPNIVDKDRISDANGCLQATAALAYVIGPMMAGFSSSKTSAAATLNMVSLAYIISGVLMLLVRLRKRSADDNAGEKKALEPSSKLDEMLLGMRFLIRHPVLRSVTLLFAVFIFVSDASIDLSIYRLKNELAQSDRVLGIVFGLASLGSICAGVIAASLRRKWGFGPCFLGSLAFQALAIGFIGITPSAWLIAAFATSFTFGLTLRNICSMSLRQQVTPDHLLGRVTSAWWTIILVLGPVGTALATAVAQKVGTSPVFMTLGAAGLITAVIGTFTPAHEKRPEAEEFNAAALAVGASKT